MNNKASLYSIVLTTLLLSACSDGTVSSGGGAGDTEEDAIAVALIEPLVGLYDLPDNWENILMNGALVSEAYLEIQEPSANGVAETRLYRVDSVNNCLEPRPSEGEVTKDPFSNRVFLDSFDFGQSTLSRSGTDLVITLFDSGNDVATDTLRATRLGIMASDLVDTCL